MFPPRSRCIDGSAVTTTSVSSATMKYATDVSDTVSSRPGERGPGLPAARVASRSRSVISRSSCPSGPVPALRVDGADTGRPADWAAASAQFAVRAVSLLVRAAGNPAGGLAGPRRLRETFLGPDVAVPGRDEPLPERAAIRQAAPADDLAPTRGQPAGAHPAG